MNANRKGLNNTRRQGANSTAKPTHAREQGVEKLIAVTNSGYVESVTLDYGGFGNLRLAKMFELFEQYFVHKLRFEYVPIVSKTANGFLIMAPDYDPEDTVPTPEDGLQKLSSYHGSESGSISDTFNCHMPNYQVVPGEWVRRPLYTDLNPNHRQTGFGRLMFFAESSEAVGTTLGYINIHYDITFAVPQLGHKGDYSDVAEVGGSYKIEAYAGGITDARTGKTVRSDDRIRLVDGAGNPVDLSEADQWKATIVDVVGGLTFDYATGQDVGIGREIYFTPAEAVYNSGSGATTKPGTGILGTVWDAARAATLYVTASAVNDYVTLKNLQKISFLS